ncbi:MAG: class I SAM-dependent methyltransferase, partial [Treponema sp.]|nr:class I SAM-dependent methyltransferase [Treponema sp.]
MFQEEFKLFQRSNETIWTDEYISKRLLDAHLDESFDGGSRRKDSREKIINWVNNNINKNSKIIDLGCGPGLYSYELGRIGHKVLGIDFNKESINYANKNKRIKNYVEYKYGNYLKENFEGTYDAALMIYCDFGALIPNEQKILLEKIKEVLMDNGSFIFDVFCYEYKRDKKEHRNWNISQGNDFWNKEPYILLEETKIFEKEGVIGTRYYLIDQI